MKLARFLLTILACALYATPAAAQNDPATLHETSQKQSTAYINNWLASQDPRLHAWAAFWILRDGQSQFLPQLQSLIESYSPIGEPIPSTFRDQHDAILVALDALIQLGGIVPPDAAASLVSEFPVQSMILLSRNGPDATAELLTIFRSVPDSKMTWLAAGNLLLQNRASGFAGAVLGTMTVHATVRIIDTERGVAEGWGGSCASSSPETRSGWPQTGHYSFANSDSGVTSGSILLANGPDPVYFNRLVDASYGVQAEGCGATVRFPDGMREHFLRALLYASADKPPLSSSPMQTIVWRGDTQFLNELRAFIESEQKAFARTGQDLIAAHLLTAEEAAASVPHLEIRLSDDREDKSAAIPALDEVPPNVRIVSVN